MNFIASPICRYIARRNFISLSNQLLGNDDDHLFPRIFFCSLVWTFTESHNVDDQMKNSVGDHKFTLIKHSNQHYQLIQGYIATSYVENGVKFRSKGLDLHNWRMKGSKYSKIEGFCYEMMRNFLGELCHFVEDNTFNAHRHENMFGVKPYGQYLDSWPALSHVELHDQDIFGCGERSYVEYIEKLSLEDDL
jgi:hypothetical protein